MEDIPMVQQEVEWCKQWLDTVSSKLNGIKPLIYLNQSLTGGNNWKPVVDAGYGLWLASYTYDPTKNTGDTGAWPFMAMQQWTDKQTVPGISGVVDGDVFFGDATAFKAYGYHKAVTPTPPPVDPCASITAERDKLNGVITGKDQTIAHLGDTINAKNAEIATLTTVGNQKDAEIANLTSQLATATEQAKKVPELTNLLSSCETSKSGYQNDLSKCQTQVGKIKAQLVPKKYLSLKIYNLLMSIE